MKLSWILSLALLITPAANAFEINALGGLNYAAPTESLSGVDQAWTGDAAPTFGFDAMLPLFDLPLSLESGVWFETATSEHTLSNISSSRETHWTEVPLLLHFHFDPFISLGAGGYLSFARGSVATTVNGVTLSQSFGAAQIKDTDSGLLLDIRARLHVTPLLCFLLDARYQHGLSNLSTVSTNLQNTRSIQVLAGASFEFL